MDGAAHTGLALRDGDVPAVHFDTGVEVSTAIEVGPIENHRLVGGTVHATRMVYREFVSRGFRALSGLNHGCLACIGVLMVQILLVALYALVVDSGSCLGLLVLALGLFVDHLGLLIGERLLLTRVQINYFHGLSGGARALLGLDLLWFWVDLAHTLDGGQ